VPRWEASPPPWVQWTNQGAVYAITDPIWKEGPIAPNFVWGLNMAIRSCVFQSGVRFNTFMGPRGSNYPQGGDTELNRRLHSQGHKAWHVRGAIVEHFIRKEQLNKAWVMQRAFRHGRGEFQLEDTPEFRSRKSLMEIPRHLFRQLYKSTCEITKARLKRRQDDVFRAEWRANYIRGQIWQWLSNTLEFQKRT
jgi:hypothetical protein